MIRIRYPFRHRTPWIVFAALVLSLIIHRLFVLEVKQDDDARFRQAQELVRDLIISDYREELIHWDLIKHAVGVRIRFNVENSNLVLEGTSPMQVWMGPRLIRGRYDAMRVSSEGAGRPPHLNALHSKSLWPAMLHREPRPFEQHGNTIRFTYELTPGDVNASDGESYICINRPIYAVHYDYDNCRPGRKHPCGLITTQLPAGLKLHDGEELNASLFLHTPDFIDNLDVSDILTTALKQHSALLQDPARWDSLFINDGEFAAPEWKLCPHPFINASVQINCFCKPPRQQITFENFLRPGSPKYPEF
jgi:hypothetical protein